MSQSNLWQVHTETGDFAELCNGLYQREISLIAKGHFTSAQAVQARLESLSYYITRTAHAMIRVIELGQSPLLLDTQNASWSAKQSKNMPWSYKDTAQENEQEYSKTISWYSQKDIYVGLVVPVLFIDHIIIDCVDRIDLDKQRIRTNVGGWFVLSDDKAMNKAQKLTKRLLKPSKKIMTSACTGHRWHGNSKQIPIIPSLRELLLSCSINWKNFKKPLAI